MQALAAEAQHLRVHLNTGAQAESQEDVAHARLLKSKMLFPPGVTALTSELLGLMPT